MRSYRFLGGVEVVFRRFLHLAHLCLRLVDGISGVAVVWPSDTADRNVANAPAIAARNFQYARVLVGRGQCFLACLPTPMTVMNPTGYAEWIAARNSVPRSR